jgi:hypothetical protein
VVDEVIGPFTVVEKPRNPVPHDSVLRVIEAQVYLDISCRVPVSGWAVHFARWASSFRPPKVPCFWVIHQVFVYVCLNLWRYFVWSCHVLSPFLFAVTSGFDFFARVNSVAVIDDNLIVCGHFNQAGGASAPGGLAMWDGNEWSTPFPTNNFPVSSRSNLLSASIDMLYSVAPFGNGFIVGGRFFTSRNVGGSVVTGDERLPLWWNGSKWVSCQKVLACRMKPQRNRRTDEQKNVQPTK